MTGTDVQLDADRVDLRDWTMSRPGSAEEAAVRLPHDAMITEPRSSDASGRSDTGWFPGGRYTYRTHWYADPAYRGREVQLRFDGIQGESVVTVNGHRVGTVRSGYTEFGFRIDDVLNWDDENEIAVDVDNSAQPAGRWYPGSGLYRSVSLRIRSRVRLEDDGVGVRTTLLGADAVVEVRTAVVNDSDRPVHVRTVLHSATACGSTSSRSTCAARASTTTTASWEPPPTGPPSSGASGSSRRTASTPSGRLTIRCHVTCSTRVTSWACT